MLVAIVVFSIGYKSVFPVEDGLLDCAPKGSMGANFGAAHTRFLTLGSLGPTFVVSVPERFSFELAFGVLRASPLLAAAVLPSQAT